MTANGRFSKLIIQGGVSAGRRLTDNCEVRAKVPEAALATVVGLPSPLTTPYCQRVRADADADQRVRVVRAAVV